jgi:hypothetical protein
VLVAETAYAAAMARRLLSGDAMSFAVVVDRVRGEFAEMPGLELTLPQAVRLWSLGADDCRFVIDALVDAGFLKWTARRTIVRTGLDLPIGREPQTSNISVRRRFRSNKSV